MPRRARIIKHAQALVTAGLLLGVLVFVLRDATFSSYLTMLSQFSVWTLAVIVTAIVISFCFAALRLKLIAQDLGYFLSLRQSIASVSLGQVGGFLFFQLVGQLIARGAYLSARNVPMAGTVLITGIERLGAAIVSGLLAIAGALFIFSKISIDTGVELNPIRMLVALAIVAATVSWFWRVPIGAAIRSLTADDLKRFLRSIAISVLVQLSMMAAYVAAAKAVAQGCTIAELAAASSLVMFAASIPISLAGWGVREMSALAALSAIGVPKEGALLVAVLIGLISILIAFLTAWGSAGFANKQPSVEIKSRAVARKDYQQALAGALPVITACLLFFQVNLPTNSNVISVNLADLFAILGGLLVLFSAARLQPPIWRLTGFNFHIVACTIVITFGLLNGVAAIGWTQWALVNKYTGWFILLAVLATGSLSSVLDLDRILRTFVIAGCAVVLFAIAEIMTSALNLMAYSPFFVGFAQNPNALAFQCLMILCAALVLKGNREPFIAIAAAGLWLTLSRAGVASGVVVMLIAAIFVRNTIRPLLLGISGAAVIAVAATTLPKLSGVACEIAWIAECTRLPSFGLEGSSANEHFLIMRKAWALFMTHPLFGAGLGVFIHDWIGPYPLVIHSTPLWLLAEFGLVGALVFFVTLVRIFVQEARVFRNNDAAGSLLILIITALSAMSVFHELLYQRTFWFLLGVALVARKAGHPELQPDTHARI
jgi:uncharacterized membrane protein YbhN (UPF0104 family)